MSKPEFKPGDKALLEVEIVGSEPTVHGNARAYCPRLDVEGEAYGFPIFVDPAALRPLPAPADERPFRVRRKATDEWAYGSIRLVEGREFVCDHYTRYEPDALQFSPLLRPAFEADSYVRTGQWELVPVEPEPEPEPAPEPDTRPFRVKQPGGWVAYMIVDGRDCRFFLSHNESEAIAWQPRWRPMFEANPTNEIHPVEPEEGKP